MHLKTKSLKKVIVPFSLSLKTVLKKRETLLIDNDVSTKLHQFWHFIKTCTSRWTNESYDNHKQFLYVETAVFRADISSFCVIYDKSLLNSQKKYYKFYTFNGFYGSRTSAKGADRITEEKGILTEKKTDKKKLIINFV